MFPKPGSAYRTASAVFFVLGAGLFALGYALAPDMYEAEIKGLKYAALFCAAASAIFAAASIRYRCVRDRLLHTGTAVRGRVILLCRNRRLGRLPRPQPFIVKCRYEWQGRQYELQSGPLEKLPSIDSEPEIYIDPKRPWRAVLDAGSLYVKTD